jgi:RHS repeat-associated protein
VLYGDSGQKPYQYVGELGYYRHEASAQGTALADLMQLGVRFYDPSIGRFTQRDPIHVDGVSDYAYVGSRALTRVDPSGARSYPADCTCWKLARICGHIIPIPYIESSSIYTVELGPLCTPNSLNFSEFYRDLRKACHEICKNTPVRQRSLQWRWAVKAKNQTWCYK